MKTSWFTGFLENYLDKYTVNFVFIRCNMFGYVYLTTNKINGKKYIGQHKSPSLDKNYLGSGTRLRSAIKKYGKENFFTVLLESADTEDQLSELEKHYISIHNAVEDEQFYNLKPGGGSSNWQTLKSRTRSPEHSRKISEAKKGKSHWTPESIASMVEKRKAQIAQGIGVPPVANRGNKDFRHKQETKDLQRQRAFETHARLMAERGSYMTEEGRRALKEKMPAIWTEEKRAQHKNLIAEGLERARLERLAAGVPTKPRRWYQNPENPLERMMTDDETEVPQGWVHGLFIKKMWCHNPEDSSQKMMIFDEKDIPEGWVWGRGSLEWRRNRKIKKVA